MKRCPVCKKEIIKLNPKHIKKCFGEDPNYKITYINYNFPLSSDKSLLEQLYIEDKYSLPMLFTSSNVNRSKISKLNIRVKQILKKSNLNFKSEFEINKMNDGEILQYIKNQNN